MTDTPNVNDATVDARTSTRSTARRDVRAVGAIVADRFRLERKIGEGGMGVVWEATHLVTRRPQALKFLKPSGSDALTAQARFLLEARATSALNHPGLVPIHDVLQLDDGTLCMVMDLLHGESFRTKLAREGALPLAEVAAVMTRVCAAVGAAHSAGIVHRDLKPDNVFLAIEGDGSTSVKVLDFGIAKTMTADENAARGGPVTAAGALLGTPVYMAPEQLLGDQNLDSRADLWALGIILYEALAGVRPTDAPDVAEVVRIVTQGDLVPLATRAPELPEPVLALVARLLRFDRDERPRDVLAVVEILRVYATHAPVEKVTAHEAFAPTLQDGALPPPPPVARARRRSGSRGLLALLAGASVVGALAWSMARPRAGSDSVAPLVSAVSRTSAHGTPLTDHPLPSSENAEAVIHYGSALRRLRIGGLQSSTELRKAAELDPSLAEAELRIALYGPWYRFSADARRKAFLAATALRSKLSPRDEALLAVARVVATEPADLASGLATLKSLEQASPDDAELPLLRYGYTSILEPDGEGQRAAAARVLELDPEGTQVLSQEATRLLEHGDVQTGKQAAEACLSRSPDASMCLATLARAEAAAGECTAELRYARRLVGLEPDLHGSYGLLAQGLAATGADPREALHQADARLVPSPGLPRGYYEIQRLVREGDLEGADRALVQAAHDIAASSAEEDHVPTALARIALAEEMGDRARALALADDFARQGSVWTPDEPSGVRLKRAYLQHEAGLLDDTAFEKQRDELARSTRALPSDPADDPLHTRWQAAGLDFIETRTEALGVLGGDGADASRGFEQTLDDFALGHALWLAGDVEHAVLVLRRAVHACRTLSDGSDRVMLTPLLLLQSRLFLGLSLEAQHDTRGACGEYRAMQDLWRRAIPRSVTLEKAIERRKALGCGP